MEQPAESTNRSETLLATKVVETLSTSPSTTVVTHATLVVGRRRRNNKRGSRKHVTIRSIDWNMVDSIFEPMHARFNFTFEGCADDEGLNSHGDLSHCLPSDSIMERDLSRERVFVKPPWELAEQIGRDFESCRRTGPTSVMAFFILLVIRWTILPIKRWLLQLLGLFNFG
jgi:hypothetical protein